LKDPTKTLTTETLSTQRLHRDAVKLMSPLLEQLSSKAAAWNVAIAEIRETEGSVLGFGLSNGNRVVLKVSSLSDEKNSGTVLEAFLGA